MKKINKIASHTCVLLRHLALKLVDYAIGKGFEGGREKNSLLCTTKEVSENRLKCRHFPWVETYRLSCHVTRHFFCALKWKLSENVHEDFWLNFKLRHNSNIFFIFHGGKFVNFKRPWRTFLISLVGNWKKNQQKLITKLQEIFL